MEDNIQKLILELLQKNQEVTTDNSIKLASLLEARTHERTSQEDHRELTRRLSDRVAHIEGKINKAAGALIVFSSLVTVAFQYVMSKIKGVS